MGAQAQARLIHPATAPPGIEALKMLGNLLILNVFHQ
jgi:hypothetical protein